MIILDNVALHGIDGREFRVSFHIPVPGITLIVASSVIDRDELLYLIGRRRKPLKGRIIFSEAQSEKPVIYSDNVMLHGSGIVLGRILDEIDLEAEENIVRILDLYGIRDAVNKPLDEIEYSVLKLISILILLSIESKIYVLLEPFAGLDNEQQSILIQEFISATRKGSSIVIITGDQRYRYTFAHDHMVIIDRYGDVHEYGGRSIGIADLLRDNVAIEVYSDSPLFLQDQILECIDGLVKANKRRYIVFIDSSRYRMCLRSLYELLKKGKMKSLRIMGRGSDII